MINLMAEIECPVCEHRYNKMISVSDEIEKDFETVCLKCGANYTVYYKSFLIVETIEKLEEYE